MSAAETLLVPELTHALETMSADRQAEAARRIAELFLAGASEFNDEHVDLFDRTLAPLIESLPTEALASLAQRIAPLRNAPPDVMRRLAGDPAIAVAGPVLTRCDLLDEADLVAIARAGSQAHLFAIAGRPRLGPAVTDVLVDCGDRDVVRNLAMNRGTELSRSGLAMLLARAVSDGVLAEKLARRADVPPQGLRSLARAAGEAVRERLLAAAPDALRAELAAIEPAPDAAEAAAHVEAWRVARALRWAGKLDEAQVLTFAHRGHIKETIAALALMCDLSIDVVQRLANDDEPDALLVLCQAAGFSPLAARCIVVAATRWRAAPSTDAMLAQFDGLSSATAQGIVQFWREYHRAA